jgi:hypothetical protein
MMIRNHVEKLKIFISPCVLVVFSMALVLPLGGQLGVQLDPKLAGFTKVEWATIKERPGGLVKDAAVYGFLGFEGHGSAPSVLLWCKNEDRIYKRPFNFIRLDAESTLAMINTKFSVEAEQWQALEGLFVEVYGELSFGGEKGLDFDLGRVSNLKRIDIRNNGHLLFSLAPPSKKN